MSDISFEHVTFSYEPNKPVLTDVSLTLSRGDYLVVLGSNGSGKSTLARHINALLTPGTGRVCVFGADTCDEEHWRAIRSSVGMVFQNPDDQMVTSVVRDDIAFGPENLGVPQPEIVERVEAALKTVGMTKLAERDPAELSGGQKQRIAIAGVLAMNPQVIVFDEPGAMLDPRGRSALRRVMRRLNESGLTIIHITHFMEEALEADRVLVVDKGAIILDGTPDEVFSHHETLYKLGLELPFEHRLHELLISKGLTLPPLTQTSSLIDALSEILTHKVVE